MAAQDPGNPFPRTPSTGLMGGGGLPGEGGPRCTRARGGLHRQWDHGSRSAGMGGMRLAWGQCIHVLDAESRGDNRGLSFSSEERRRGRQGGREKWRICWSHEATESRTERRGAWWCPLSRPIKLGSSRRGAPFFHPLKPSGIEACQTVWHMGDPQQLSLLGRNPLEICSQYARSL